MTRATTAERLPPLELALDPARSTIVFATGTKGTGKSTFNRVLYRAWPLAKLCVDVNGEADPGEGATRIGEPPAGMPEPEEDRQPHLHYLVDPGSPTYTDDLDRSIAGALYPQNTPALIWCGEVGEFTQANRTGPQLRRLLMQSRHYKASALFDGPRPMDIDPLVLAQADMRAIFDLPNEDDIIRVAKTIGWPAKQLQEEVAENRRRGPHWYMLHDQRTRQLYRMPPLPKELTGHDQAPA